MDKCALRRGQVVVGVNGGGSGGQVGREGVSAPYSANQRLQRATGPKRKGQSCVSAILCFHSGH